MLKYLRILIFLSFGLTAFGQAPADTVYLINKRKLILAIVGESKRFIEYKEPKFPNGPSYSINKKDIYKIARGSGEVKEFTIPVKEKIERVDKKKIEYKNNYVGINVIPFAILSCGASYEHIFKKKLGVRLYGQFSPSDSRFLPGNDINFLPKTTLGGLEINSYLNGQSVVSIYGGIGIYTATFKSTLIYKAATQSAEAVYFDTQSSFNAATLNVGALIHLGRSAFIQTYAGVGGLKENFSKQYLIRYNCGIVIGLAF
ncbi:MAG: hypothetical protein ACXVPN_10280 [Bacteroidia bacterium]